MRSRSTRVLTGLMDQCSTCKKVLDTGYFVKNKTIERGYARVCIECKRKRNVERYLSSPMQIKKKTLVLQAKEVPCGDCNKSYPHWVMDLDHLPGHVKLFALRDWQKHSIEEIEAEIAKCEAVCSNCHRQRTYDRRL